MSVISIPERKAKGADARSRVIVAKGFMVAQILEEAAREGVTLSDYERRLLDFSGDMMRDTGALDARFDYDVYEKKVVGLVSAALRRAREASWQDEEGFRRAEAYLKTEDSYLALIVGRGVGSVMSAGDAAALKARRAVAICYVVAIFFVYEAVKSRSSTGRWAILLSNLIFVGLAFAAERLARRVLRSRVTPLGVKRSN